MEADASGDALALIAGGRRVAFGGLRPPPAGSVLGLTRRGCDAIAARIAGYKTGIAPHAHVIAMRGAIQSAAVVAASHRFLAADVTGHKAAPAPVLRTGAKQMHGQ